MVNSSAPDPHPASTDVAVIGGGVIGCAIAHSLATRGIQVTVFERGKAGREATWAAGGMLSPLGEGLSPDPFLELGLASLERYPEFLAAIRSASGIPIELIRCGKVVVAFDEGRREALKERARRLSEEGFAARWLGADALRAVEPGISNRALGALHLEREGQVENRVLAEAVARAAAAAGAEIFEGLSIQSIRSSRGAVDGVVLAGGARVDAGTVVIAAGAWSGQLEGLPRALPVRPVRGQMLSMSPVGAAPRSIVETDDIYLIPRPDGKVVVGSTMEEAGFDGSTTVEALGEIEAAAVEVLPGLEASAIVETWAGLRPGTPDDLPILGMDPEIRGLVYATGHFRNGILLAAVTADIISDLIVDGKEIGTPLSLFHPARFVDVSLAR